MTSMSDVPDGAWNVETIGSWHGKGLSKAERIDLAKFTSLLLKNYGGSND